MPSLRVSKPEGGAKAKGTYPALVAGRSIVLSSGLLVEGKGGIAIRPERRRTIPV